MEIGGELIFLTIVVILIVVPVLIRNHREFNQEKVKVTEDKRNERS